MTSRERVLTALQHKQPDRIPFDLGSRSSAIEIDAYKHLLRYLGMDKETNCFLRAHAEMDDEIIDKLGVDTKWIREMPENAWRTDGDDTIFMDAWNVPWKKRKDDFYYEIESYPLINMSTDEVLNMRWPDLISPEAADKMGSTAAGLHSNSEYFLASDIIGAGIFERSWYLRGYEKFLMEVMLEKEFAHSFFKKILEHQIEAYSLLLDKTGSYIDCVWITDDVATQDSLMFSPDIYREMIKPYQKELISYIQGRGVQVIFHSCGAIRELLPDFIDMGAVILHPIQISAKGIDTADLKREYGKDIVFWGGGCDIEILQFGKKEEVVFEVKKRIDDLSADGGFIFTPTHCIQPGTPPENIIAMADTLRDYGKY